MLTTLLAGTLFLPMTGAAHQPHPYKHPITIWVPPYAVSRSQDQLKVPGVSDTITHLDLQFWEPTKTGEIHLVDEPEVTPTAISGLRDWAHGNGIRAMLCIFNGEAKWDWPLAKAAFADHPDLFVKSLVSEAVRLDMDGVDVDLEGPAQYEGDKPAFLSFMTDLSKQLRAQHKQLTVDSFCYIWNAPNQGWWADLFKVVDGVNCMGYDETGCAAAEWRSYGLLKKAAGRNAAKLLIGVLSDRAKWQGSALQDQLDWIKSDGSMGVAIWDAQLRATAWKTQQTWATLLAVSRRT